MSLLILIGLFIGYPYLHALDQGVMTLVQEHRQPMLDEIAVTFTLIGEFRNMLMFSALLTGLLLLCRQWRQAIFAGGVLLCTALLNTVTKQFFARILDETEKAHEIPPSGANVGRPTVDRMCDTRV